MVDVIDGPVQVTPTGVAFWFAMAAEAERCVCRSHTHTHTHSILSVRSGPSSEGSKADLHHQKLCLSSALSYFHYVPEQCTCDYH